jgi:hypothetical protein
MKIEIAISITSLLNRDCRVTKACKLPVTETSQMLKLLDEAE